MSAPDPRDRRAPAGDPGPDGPVQVSPLTVPALLGGLVLGFLAAYLLLWWGAAVLVLAVLVALGAVLRGSEHREAAFALVLGAALGYGGVILLALFRGVL